MDAAMEDPRGYHSRAQSDPHFFRDANWFHSDDEVSGFPNQMGSGRRDARVVCETFSSVRNFSSVGSPKMRQSGSQKGLKSNLRRRSLAYSRNPLLACFVGESVLSSRTIHLSPNCDSSGGSQRTFFSLIPVDRSRVNEKTGEPQSPQLSCIGQVKHRQVKIAKTAEVVTEDLARMDINDGVIPHSMHISKPTPGPKFQKQASFKLHNGESFKLQKEESFRLQFEESFKLQKVQTFKLRKEESFKVQKEESFKRQKEESFRLHKEVSFKLQKKEMPLEVVVDDIPHLDLGAATESSDDMPSLDSICENNAARLTRCRRVVDDEKKAAEDDEKVSSPSQRNSIRYLNHFLKQKFGASLVKSAFVCGWSSGEVSPRSSKSERSEIESEQYEIDLSRFASGDFQPKTPSFRDTRYYQHTTGKKLADIRVHSYQQAEGTTDRRWWKDEAEGKEQNDGTGVNNVSDVETEAKEQNDVIFNDVSEGETEAREQNNVIFNDVSEGETEAREQNNVIFNDVSEGKTEAREQIQQNDSSVNDVSEGETKAREQIQQNDFSVNDVSEGETKVKEQNDVSVCDISTGVTEGKEQNDVRLNAVSKGTINSSTIVIKCSPSTVILQPATEAALWKRRCMPRPPSLEVQT